MKRAKGLRNTKAAGDLTEVRFLLAAMALGLVVGRPYGDNARYDFFVDGGRRISRVQVKLCGGLSADGKYHVNCGRHTLEGNVAYTEHEIDFLAVYLATKGRWYIIPVEELRGRVGLYIPKDGGGEFAKYEEAWEFLLNPSAAH